MQRWKDDMNRSVGSSCAVGDGGMANCLTRKDDEDLAKFLDLDFILANTASTDSAPGSGTGAGLQGEYSIYGMPQSAYSSLADMSSPPPPYNNSLMELLRSEVDTNFCHQLPGNNSNINSRFLVRSSPFTAQDFAEGIKVEPSMDGYGPVIGMVPQSCPKIKQEGNVSCMMSYEQPRLANSPQAAGNMTPPLSPDDLMSSDCQTQLCHSMTFPQSYRSAAGYPHPHSAPAPQMQLPYQSAHQFGLYEDGLAMQPPSQRVLLTPPSSPLEIMGT